MNKAKLGDLLRIKHGFAFKSENYVNRSQYALIFSLMKKKLHFMERSFPKSLF